MFTSVISSSPRAGRLAASAMISNTSLVVEVDAGDGEVARGCFGFSSMRDDPVALDLGDAVAPGSATCFSSTARRGPGCAKRLGERPIGSWKMLSPRMTASRPPRPKRARQAERLGDAAGLVLDPVGELAAEVLAAAEQRRRRRPCARCR